MRLKRLFSRRTVGKDAMAGVVLGVESVPDGLAGGLLAGVNPVFGLHAYMVGTFTGALFTSSSFMAVQATGAMAIVVADVGAVQSGSDPEGALFALTVMTGVVMLIAGFLRLGSVLRFVSNAVMVGFISAVGVNIVLGQLDSITGYESDGANRILRAIDTLLNIGSWDLATLAVGIATVGLILGLQRTPLGPLGMVVAIVTTSGVVALSGADVLTLESVASIPEQLPTPRLPDFTVVPDLLLPALSLAFIGLVQGAGISANVPNSGGDYPDASRDFIGQGAANVACGFLRGMPVGGSMSATSLVVDAGARSRMANLTAGVVIALIVLLFGSAVESVAMPALAGLLILVGIRTVKPESISSVWNTGSAQAVIFSVTFVLTMVIPLQYAVLVGVGMSMVLHVVGGSNRLRVIRLEITDEGIRESDPPEILGDNEVVVLQPYGSLFFASADAFEDQLPLVGEASRNSVVMIRLRGFDDLGSTFVTVLRRYAESLESVGSKLVLVSAGDRVNAQLEATGAASAIGEQNLYRGDEWVGRTLRRAHSEALAWVASDPGQR